jgi:phospholipid/cholesterol/gamma-HCH transport system ATP-binding protein
MRDAAPILQLEAARPVHEPGRPFEPAISMTVAPGDLLLIESRDPRRAAAFADLCSGLLPLASGSARFLGQDWAELPHDMAGALRGRMGRVFGDGGWIGFLDVATNILMAPLHHTRRGLDALRADAAAMAHRFGLPGLPMGRPVDLQPADLRRAACVRAFLTNPMLLLMEYPVLDQDTELLPPLMSAIEHTRARGAAVIWLTRTDQVWRDRTLPVTARLRLVERGLLAHRWAA